MIINTEAISLEKTIYDSLVKGGLVKNVDKYIYILNKLINLINSNLQFAQGLVTREINKKDLLNLLYSRGMPVPKSVTYKPGDIIEGVIYNPLFDDYSPSGYLFKVYRFEKNRLTGQPQMTNVGVQETNSKTKEVKYKLRSIEKHGNTPYIKIPIDMGEEFIEIWKEVKSEYVHNYPTNYDSCNLFDNETDCNKGKGLGKTNCIFENNICRANINK